jgi:hypothetical protein
MEERVTECLNTIREAITRLLASAKNEVEMVGLITMLFAGWEETFNKALDSGAEKFEKREEKEGK